MNKRIFGPVCPNPSNPIITLDPTISRGDYKRLNATTKQCSNNYSETGTKRWKYYTAREEFASFKNLPSGKLHDRLYPTRLERPFPSISILQSFCLLLDSLSFSCLDLQFDYHFVGRGGGEGTASDIIFVPIFDNDIIEPFLKL